MENAKKLTPDELQQIIGQTISEKKGSDIIAIDVAEKTVIADYFIIASALNASHCRALAEYVDEILSKKHGIEPLRREGMTEGRWIALDYGSVIVHIFQAQVRAFYQLERLWVDGANVRHVE